MSTMIRSPIHFYCRWIRLVITSVNYKLCTSHLQQQLLWWRSNSQQRTLNLMNKWLKIPNFILDLESPNLCPNLWNFLGHVHSNKILCFWSPPASILYFGNYYYYCAYSHILARAWGHLPVAHMHILGKSTRAVNMAILNASKQIEGTRLEHHYNDLLSATYKVIFRYSNLS